VLSLFGRIPGTNRWGWLYRICTKVPCNWAGGVRDNESAIQNYVIVLEGFAAIRRRARVAGLAVLACACVLLLGHFLRTLNIVVNPLAWSSAQIISALLSFIIAANVLVRYHGTGNRVSLLLGLTLAICGLIHLGAIWEFYSRQLAGKTELQVPLSWMVGQTLLGVLFLVAYTANKRLAWPREQERNIFAVLAFVVAVFCLVLLAFMAFPHAPPIHPHSLLPRPWDLLPAGIFIAAAVVLQRISGRDHYAFDAVLVWVAGMNAAGHLIASQSVRQFDAPAAAAQLLITLSYLVLLGATLLDNAQLFGQVSTLAISDSLTGLANYRRLVDILQSELERSGRTNRSFSLLLMDLDGLKLINDQYGHLTGSRALCRVADTLRMHCRSIDTAARYGGDEFALVLPESDESAAEQVAGRIRQRLEADEEKPPLSLSIGLATFPHCGTSVQQLLECADRALYAMKLRSKSGTPQMRDR
jgi:diguanylate cyclase (GGDEF)-like protein